MNTTNTPTAAGPDLMGDLHNLQKASLTYVAHLEAELAVYRRIVDSMTDCLAEAAKTTGKRRRRNPDHPDTPVGFIGLSAGQRIEAVMRAEPNRVWTVRELAEATWTQPNNARGAAIRLSEGIAAVVRRDEAANTYRWIPMEQIP